ncbi:MAG: prepilin-type N-terminal cleavage/methylation domain-containing protein [Pseudomonadota bacterium]
MINGQKIFKQRAFTLIELVIVLVILGILSSIVIPKYVDLSTSAKASAKKAMSGAVKSAFAISLAENSGSYPTVTSLATYVQTGTAATTGIVVDIDGSPYTVPTYTNAACSAATADVANTVQCVGDIPA